ncbi:hypothetical protein R1flu_026881 [Riccia fluitans]|uniref:Dynein heavy chain coiled coil stalk domain-containing protein n=1 Tax=Riccia fluitans TaxID=41844 RepID=A0ABD1XLA6_9MARC
MMNYYGIFRIVVPKRAAVATAEKNLKNAQKELDIIQKQIGDLSAQLATLNAQFAVSTAEQQDLKSKADLMEKRLDAASRLIFGFGSEQERWTKELEELGVARVKLLGDCLVSSSFLRSVLLLDPPPLFL